jgi:predicted Ser/Thr protein kinase
MIQCPKCSAENSEDSRFCKSCGEELSSLSQAPTIAAPEGKAPPAPIKTPHVGRIVSSDSVPAGGFTPGTILDDRYRIIGLLGRGGMGEVYRADDLKLGQPVALKFLPPAFAKDSVRRERFFAEVRITRQLSHPNICRVYDIGEVDGRHFLSMEYIDGEDLASLMKRIGHLSNEKALDIARQLVAGLTVAHERGVLHRDLKPANIMLDGHGRVRITDFGLAIAVGDESHAEEIAGTPAYMAPEQLTGKGATVRSDIYSLGLILYEIYTGKKAFNAKTLAELREQKETQTPRAPSEIREGIDLVVERVIQRCMEKDPNSRPTSAAQLAQALPGGDPLAAAIAAGETPSPEMVAAAGSKEGLRPLVAWGLLAFIIVGTIAGMALNDRVAMHQFIPFEKHPEFLLERVREIVRMAGYPEEFADSAYGFIENSEMMRYFESSDKTLNRWKTLDSQAVLFWYRQSPRVLADTFGDIEPDNPSLNYSGEILITLDTGGQLVSFQAVPPQEVLSQNAPASGLDWKVFFVEAGLDISQWNKTEPKWIPFSYADSTIAWSGFLPNRPNVPFQIEAAAYQGKPVRFEVIGPWDVPKRDETVPLRKIELIAIAFTSPVLLVVIAGGLYFALRNLRLGRGDRRNATRLALLTLCLTLIRLAFDYNHVLEVSVIISFALWICLSLTASGLLWVLYMAIEPFVRRRWPRILISWTRLIAGNWRDPLVARDALIGSAFGLFFFSFSIAINFLASPLLGNSELAQPLFLFLGTVLGIRFFIAAFLGVIITCIFSTLAITCFLFILRVLLRNQKAAFAAFVLILAAPRLFLNIWTFPLILIFIALLLFLLMRFGLVAVGFALLVQNLFARFSPTLDYAWYSRVGYVALAIFTVIVLYAFYTSLGGRPMFGTPRLDE